MLSESSNFIFATCQLGAESALKEEVVREHPLFHPAFARPGFVTFKWTGKPERFPGESFELSSVFARAYGVSYGKFSAADGTAEMRGRLIAEFAVSGACTRLHVWERDRHLPGEEPLGFVHGEWATPAREAICAAISAAMPAGVTLGAVADGSERVLDVIVVDDDQWWVGCHRHSPAHSAYPGGRPEVVVPPEAPSRAYGKLAEGLLWSQAPIQEGDVAVEIGSAPGGASYLLLSRGLEVVGIDPGAMDPCVFRFKGKFRHLRKSASFVERKELPASVQWLLLDMNAEPAVSLSIASRIVSELGDGLLGVMLTIKLNHWGLAEKIPAMLEKVKAMGVSRVRATQLASNRQEFFVYGVTRFGMRRRPRGLRSSGP